MNNVLDKLYCMTWYEGGFIKMADYTQEQLDTILAEKIAEAKNGLFTEEELLKRVTSETDRRVETGIQKGLETQKQKWERELSERANLSAEQLAQKNFEEKLKDISTREAEVNKRANNLEAKNMLADAQIPKAQYDKIIGMLVSSDTDTTKANVQNFINMFNETKVDIETRVKSEFTKIPSPRTSTGNEAITKTDFIKMTYADKLALKLSNPDLYKEFIK